MKVKFSCEKCGYVYEEKVYEGELADFAINETDYVMSRAFEHHVAKHWTCPNCSLYYGQLNVKMVAEALNAATTTMSFSGALDQQARFVIRLLGAMHKVDRDGTVIYDPQGWLLAIARASHE